MRHALDLRCSEGGFFNARLSFPKEYPQRPPVCRFTSEMWHPNGAPESRPHAVWSVPSEVIREVMADYKCESHTVYGSTEIYHSRLQE